MKKETIVTSTVLCLALGLLVACTNLGPDETKVTVKNCGPNLDQVCVEVSGTWKKFTADGDDFARDFAVTREVDPDLLRYSAGSAKGTIILTLNDSSKVSYNGNLSYSSYWSPRIPARTSGNTVYGFVASNPSAVQAFLDQYQSRAVALQYISNITLDNNWPGDQVSTIIESQASHQGVRAFLGSGVGRAGVRDGGGPPEI